MIAIFNATDLITVLFLVFLEGILSLDNALVIAMVVRHLPQHQQKKALTYGIFSAFAFRFIALFWLIRFFSFGWIRIAGGAYLVYTATKEALSKKEEKRPDIKSSWMNFWKIIILVEGLDIAFSVDSVLSAVSVSRNYFVVLSGGIIGIVMMRFAARLFVFLMDHFPKLEDTACLLVSIIGFKLIAEGVFPYADFHSAQSPLSWLFGMSIFGAMVFGFSSARTVSVNKQGNV